MAIGIVDPQGGAVLGKPVHSPAAWLPADVADPESWTWELDAAEVEELVAAAKHAVGTGKDITVSRGSAEGATQAAARGGRSLPQRWRKTDQLLTAHRVIT